MKVSHGALSAFKTPAPLTPTYKDARVELYLLHREEQFHKENEKTQKILETAKRRSMEKLTGAVAALGEEAKKAGETLKDLDPVLKRVKEAILDGTISVRMNRENLE